MFGSVVENLFVIYWVYKDGRREVNNDIDVMFVDCLIVVLERGQLERLDILEVMGLERSYDMKEYILQFFKVEVDCSLYEGC